MSRNRAQQSQPDFRRYPLRGIFTELATELGKDRRTIQLQYRLNSPRIVPLVNAKIAARRRAVGGRP